MARSLRRVLASSHPYNDLKQNLFAGDRPAQIPEGRLIEVSGGISCARTSTAVSFVIRAQEAGLVVAWVQPRGGTLYPPDLAEAGVDLASLVVVQIPAGSLPKATELLLRSGAFGLVVLDLTAGIPPRAEVWQARLGGLLRHHATRLVVLTVSESSAPSLGAWVSLRIEPKRERRGPGRFVLFHRVLKDKSGSGWSALPEGRRGPAGLG